MSNDPAQERDKLTTQLYSADPSDQADAYIALQTLELAEQAAAIVNHGLAKAFLKLGPPPADEADDN